MLPFSVVEGFDVFKRNRLDLGARSVANAMHPLVFEAVELALCWGVIPAKFRGKLSRRKPLLRCSIGTLKSTDNHLPRTKRARCQTGHKKRVELAFDSPKNFPT